jgi:hypothetical protein
MSSDQDDKREAKQGAVVTLLGEALQGALTRTEGKQFALFAPADPLPDDAAPGELDQANKRGRPPGARNKATEELRAFVRARYGDPGIKLLERCFADPKALATALGAPSAWDVAKAQSEWMLRLMPFFWAAMPAELKVQAKGFLAIAMSGQPGAFKPGDKVIDLDPFSALLQIAQNQGLSDAGQGLSNDDQSNDPPVTIDRSKG